jgi:uncharacterized membrane protein
LKIVAREIGAHLGRQEKIVIVILFALLLCLQISPSVGVEDGVVVQETINLTAYFDGFVLANYVFQINKTYPVVNVRLLGENHENLVFYDEDNMPLDHESANDGFIVYSLGASVIKASYLTQDLTIKTGKYWTLKAEVSSNTIVVLPESATIISLNVVPEKIESSNGQITLVMPKGLMEITYTAEHNPVDLTKATDYVTPEMPWLLIIALFAVSIPSLASVFVVVKRKKVKKPEPEETEEDSSKAVDVDKLFAREKDLRQEEVQVIRFLSEKNGSALEAELYEKLQLPRTTTWRLIRRLERMEIVEIRKSRRQNIVSIRKKYMKKQLGKLS